SLFGPVAARLGVAKRQGKAIPRCDPLAIEGSRIGARIEADAGGRMLLGLDLLLTPDLLHALA
ncbi:MAG: hypothetical protein K9G48_12275, partial [Reyranella sp.]|nr:hypothetical protein [Reyranella sp.]